MEIMRESNEWWISDTGNLHIGDTIKSQDGYCTVSSHRYNYHKKDLKLVVHQPYCFVYSDKFPFLDVWECYKKKDGEQPTASISWTGRWSFALPEDIKDKIYNVKKIHHYPYFVDDIEFPYIIWKNGEKTQFDDTDVTFKRTWTEFDKTNVIVKYSTSSRYVAAFFDKLDDNSDDDNDDDNDAEYVDVFDTIEDKWLFRVNHNTYHREYICKVVEFIENNEHTYVLINDEHSVLSLYDMEGNVYKQFDDGDDFYTEYYRVIDDEKEWIVFYGFVWSPLPFMKIFDVEKMMDIEDYEPELYTNYLRTIDKNSKNIVQASNKVCRFSEEYYTPTEYRDLVKNTEDEIERRYITKLNSLWKNDNIFKKILKDQTVANIKYKNTEVKEKVADLLNKEVTNGSCIGGNSGCKFRDNLLYVLSPFEDIWNDWKPTPSFITGNQDTFIVDAIASTIMYPYKKYNNIIDNYETKGISLKVVNLIFSLVFDKIELEIQIKFNMMPTEDTQVFHFPDDDNSVNVLIDIK
jgi:hypothetical protein